MNPFRLLHLLAENRKLRARLAKEARRREQLETLVTGKECALAHAQQNTLTVGEIAASIVHQVNQPLSAVLTNAETCVRWLSRPQPDIEQALQAAQRTARETDRVVDVINGLKTLASTRRAARSSLSLNDTVKEIVSHLRADLEQHAIDIQFQFGSEWVHGNRVQLEQVVFNLMRNAIESMASVMDRPRRIEINTSADGFGMVWVEIKDNGVGFSRDIADKLFDPMFTTKESGMGMGLAISRAIVESHGGKLLASSEGQGARFCFSVPRMTGAAYERRDVASGT